MSKFPSDIKPLEGEALHEAERLLDLAAEEAKRSSCLRALCGAVVTDKNGVVIGKGGNSLPGGEKPKECLKDHLGAGFKSDRTCCTHAEARAILDAMKNGTLEGGSIFFTRIDEEGRRKNSGQPYCTICSKMALEVGLKSFVLAHDFGVVAYPSDFYNDLSFEYGR